MMNEEWKPVNIRGVRFPGYYVSNMGRILSKKGKKEKLLTVQEKYAGSGRGNAAIVNLSKPKNVIVDEYYNRTSYAISTKQQVHQLVMWAFRPIDDYPPEQLKDDWNDAPESFKQWVRDTVVIDHINDNAYDNRLENLRYVTPKQNNYYRKHHVNRTVQKDLRSSKNVSVTECTRQETV